MYKWKSLLLEECWAIRILEGVGLLRGSSQMTKQCYFDSLKWKAFLFLLAWILSRCRHWTGKEVHIVVWDCWQYVETRSRLRELLLTNSKIERKRVLESACQCTWFVLNRKIIVLCVVWFPNYNSWDMNYELAWGGLNGWLAKEHISVFGSLSGDQQTNGMKSFISVFGRLL